MSLTAGTKLGPYEILSAIGAGGMGEVYKARDTRLERTVAVKVLPSHMSASPESRQRFEREAKTISQLSHPHICALYDVGREGETEYLVMEYLEGETLSDRLAKGALPLEQTLRYGVEIADALDKAHRQGIVHRDLKPANVMLTKSGVKLLDFGLAKAMAPAAPAGSLTALPTQQGLTQQGTILGTYQYMAPEQLEGKEADARTDIFAFGCVLYEMVTGRKAFTGTSQASLIGAILKDEPIPISSVAPMTPPALDRLVKTCLAKDPEDRWQSAADIKRELGWVGEGSHAGAALPVVGRRKNRERLAWTLTAVALIAAVVALRRPVPPAAAFFGPLRLSIVLADKSALRGLALSPDGKRVVFVARDSSGMDSLWIRSLDSAAVQALPGTLNPSFPFWSPDSRYIGFFADGRLKKIDASGGPPQTLCYAPISRGGTWNREGVILFSPVVSGPLYRVSANGGTSTPATRFDKSRGEDSHRWPYFLPDGRHFLFDVASFASGGQNERTGIYVGSLDSEEQKFLLRANSSVAYAPPGYLLFVRDRNLMAQAFDAKALVLQGEPFSVAEDVQYFPQHYGALVSVSDNGGLVYGPRSASGISQLVWFDRSGKEVGRLGAAGDQSNPRISPDGRRVMLNMIDPQTGNMDVWIYEISGGVATRFTSAPSFDAAAVWAPDSSQVVFSSNARGVQDLYRKAANGTGSDQPILTSSKTKYAMDWSPDSRFILFCVFDAATNLELWALPTQGDAVPTPFLRSTFGVNHGQFSPDGRWVAYSSNESGKWEVYVAPFPGPGSYWKVSRAGGSEPRWRRDGKELFYLAPDGKVMALDVRTGTSFSAEEARPLFQTRRREHVSSVDLFSYDVSVDGQRFLVNTDVSDVATPPLTVFLNWTTELGKR